MPVPNDALLIAGKKLEVVRLTRVIETVRSRSESACIGRIGHNQCAVSSQRIKCRRCVVADDFREAVVLEDHDHHVIGPRQACENMRAETKAENDHESEFHNKRLTLKHDQEWAG